MRRQALVLALLLATTAQVQAQTRTPRLGPPPGQPPSTERLAQQQPAPAPTPVPAPERIPIDLGPDAPTGRPPEKIDILASTPTSEAANEAVLKECEDQREAGVVAGEIVVCRQLEVPTDQLFSGSREAWLKDYAARTQAANTVPPPDVDGTGLPNGMAPLVTIRGCFVPPCPKEAALMIDVEAIETPPAGSDAERVAQGLAPVEGDDAPLSDDARQRIAEQLGLPKAGSAEP
jgi:hypothetical protein